MSVNAALPTHAWRSGGVWTAVERLLGVGFEVMNSAGSKLLKRHGSETTHAQVLDLEIFLDAVFRAFATEAGLLDAAERSDFI